MKGTNSFNESKQRIQGDKLSEKLLELSTAIMSDRKLSDKERDTIAKFVLMSIAIAVETLCDWEEVSERYCDDTRKNVEEIVLILELTEETE